MQLSSIILESDEAQLASQLKQALDKEMEDGKLDEIAITAVGFLSYALASNTILDMLGKYVGKALRKGGFNKAADKAEAVHNWAHTNEKNFIKLIGGVISPFVRDPSKREVIAKGLFIAVLAGLGIKAGIGAIQAIKGLNAGTAVLSAVKGALKGRDIANLGAEILTAI
tara:strand:- start:3456 stop:3962 length:507 start_codon:yes stop_codon:yes gene_type:complete